MTAPVASGWSGRRVGFTPTGKRRLITAHAKSRHLIGMEVLTVDGQNLRREKGMVQQIIDAFAREGATRMVTLELFSRGSQNEPIKISFARP
jgi:hypothetical protein